MCWSKRSPLQSSTVTTTAFTPTGSSAVNDTFVYCQYPAVECSQDAIDEHCSFKGKCCELDSDRYCVCFDDYTGRFCESQKFDPWMLESLEANSATIGIAVGVILFIVLVMVALLVFVIVTRKKKRSKKPVQDESSLTQVQDHNGNGKNGISSEEFEMMLSDSNHNTKPTPG